MLTIMTNVAMNNKAGVIGEIAAMLVATLSIPVENCFVRVCSCTETFMNCFAAILVSTILIVYRHLLKKTIMSQDITLLIDVEFLDYNRQKRRKCT